MKRLKQLLSVTLTGLLLVSLLSFCASALSGDVNADGAVDMKDVLTLRKHISNLAFDADRSDADLNADGLLDMKDVRLLRLVIVYGVVPESLLEDPARSDEADAVIARVIELVNQRRAEAGLPALQPNARLQEAARIRAIEIREQFSHTRPNGTPCFTVFQELGITYTHVGENIAYGFTTPEAVMDGWMTSDGHRKNILDPTFTHIGVVFEPESKSWVQVFFTP